MTRRRRILTRFLPVVVMGSCVGFSSTMSQIDGRSILVAFIFSSAAAVLYFSD